MKGYQPVATHETGLDQNPLIQRSSSTLFDIPLPRSNGSETASSVSDDAYLDARSTSKSSVMSIEGANETQDLKTTIKRTAVYTFLILLAAVFLFVAFAGSYHSAVFYTYDSTPYVSSNSGAPNSDLTLVDQNMMMINSLAARGFGTKSNPIVVDFVGDSLVNDAEFSYGLLKHVDDILKESTSLHFTLINRGSSGCKVNCTLTNLPGHIAQDRPNIIVLLSNSDVTNSKPSWSADVWAAYKATYEVQLQTLINMAQKAVGKNNFAIAGPTVMSEGPFIRPARFEGFENMLEDIRDINLRMVRQNPGVVYINQRAAMQSIMVPWWPLYSLYNTKDGEHFSALGMKLFAANSARFLLS